MRKRHRIKLYKKSMDEVQADCRVWAKEIGQSYSVDLIVFIAKSGFLFAQPMAEVLGCNMVDIKAARPTGRAKDRMKKVIVHIPTSIILRILRSPFVYSLHDKKAERNLETSDRYVRARQTSYRKILVVDDSVDTGWTLFNVLNKLKEDFPGSEIRSAAYSVIDYSKNRVKVDYFRYRNTIVLTAVSVHSAEYEQFISCFDSWILSKGGS